MDYYFICNRFTKSIIHLPSTLSKNQLSQVICNETVIVGDLNLGWLRPASDAFKEQCDTLNLMQLINTPTWPNPKCHEKSSLIDIILTNAPSKFSAVGVFANDVSDQQCDCCC